MSRSSSSRPTRRGRSADPDAEVDLEITINGIYSFHLLEVQASSLKSFSLEVHDSRIYYAAFGTQMSETSATAIPQDGIFRIVLSIIGTYAQLPTVLGAELRYGKGPGVERVEYGVRFYPYVSSAMRFSFSLQHGNVRAFKVNNGEDVRLLWSQASIKDQAGKEMRRHVAHSSTGWQEALAWLPAPQRPQSLLIHLPVRASTRAISKSILHPSFTWLASMVAITLAAQLATPEVVVAAVVGSWSFLLREWADSARAHQLNLLSGIFIFEGVSAAAWGFTLERARLAAYVLGAFLILFTIDLLFASVRFEYRGYLPARVALPWAWTAKTLEKLRARRRRKLHVAGFDWERVT